MNFKKESSSGENEIFNGKTFVLTGSLNSFTRKEASELIEKNGGKVTASVSSNTDYLVAGENAGSKLKKAGDLSIKILDESDFLRMLQESK